MFGKVTVRLFLAVVAFGAILGPVGSSEAGVIYSTLGPGDTYAGNLGLEVGYNSSNDWVPACAFTPATTVSFEEMDLAVGYDVGHGGMENSIVVQLRADNSGAPGSVLEAFTFTNLPVFGSVSSGNLRVGDSVLHPELVAGTQYWVTVLPGAAGASDAWNLSSPTVDGLLTGSSNGGSTWGAAIDGQQAGFRIDGSAVPEPSTLALLGVGALGLAVYAWRKRRRNVDRID
ncbi:MAG: PEP-CTERM sorting domain-containing protein [Thermoguttaceae bacterium]|jgi:hypothetical protein